MKTINKPIENLGGLTKIWAVPYKNYNLYGTTVSISDSSNVYEIYCTPESMFFQETPFVTKAGFNYATEISGYTPGLNNENKTAFEYIEKRKWVVVFRDGNGNYIAAGSNSQGLNAFANLETGKDTVGKAGYFLSFKGETTERAKFVNNPF